MKAYVITLHGVEVSEEGARKCVESSVKVDNDFIVTPFHATTADMAEVTLKGCGFVWNYPWEGQTTDLATGLVKRAYPTKYKERRIACSMSHYRLWYKAIEENEPILVLEHDAEFTNKLDYDYILESRFDIIGINNPLAATRRAHQLKDLIESSGQEIMTIPDIDDFNVPQGLAGNSAYIIKPAGAKNVIEAAKEHGMWPNDALMCKQLIPRMGVTRKFYTKVQGLPSTTTD